MPCLARVPVDRLALHSLPGFHEPFSAATHLLGALAFAIAGVPLLRRGGRGDAARLAFLGTYVVSGVFLMSVSGAYHMTATGGTARAVMLRLDHAAIFVLIAGTFTPVHGLLFRGALRWGPLAMVWAAPGAGVAINALTASVPPEWVWLTCYLALGWLGAVSGALVWWWYGFGMVRPLLWGGLAYSAGAVADVASRPIVIREVIHAHEVFHVAVLAGAAFHYVFVWRFAVRMRNDRSAARA
jgi:channel protein (hemolysin III family)